MARLLIRGSVGPKVVALQENLTELGYTVDADGTYGADTEAQVRSFQDAYGLKVDGAAGEETHQKIDELLEEIEELQEEEGVEEEEEEEDDA
jgi:peptidoglycan hydrolase-like protein with peptidoglycan-binding domain